jgi:hypothetical protein
MHYRQWLLQKGQSDWRHELSGKERGLVTGDRTQNGLRSKANAAADRI